MSIEGVHPCLSEPTPHLYKMEKHNPLPLPVPATARRSSRHPKIFLGVIIILATLLNFGPTLDKVKSSCSSILPSGRLDKSVIYEDKWLEDHSRCPVQPKALHPKMVWDMTEDDRKISIQRYSQAVVCI